MRKPIRPSPFADARAALKGLLWREGSSGEAESHRAAAAGLDQRYRQADWLQQAPLATAADGRSNGVPGLEAS